MRVLRWMLCVALLMTAVVGSASAAQAENNGGPMGAVFDLFAGVSAMDGDAMRASAATDFHLLEDGEVWDMRQLVDAVSRKPADVARRNFFAPVRTVINGDRAWVSYWNKAVFESKDGQDVYIWLESAVLARKDGCWLIEMLHSTKLHGDQAPPADVTLVEAK